MYLSLKNRMLMEANKSPSQFSSSKFSQALDALIVSINNKSCYEIRPRKKNGKKKKVYNLQ